MIAKMNISIYCVAWVSGSATRGLTVRKARRYLSSWIPPRKARLKIIHTICTYLAYVSKYGTYVGRCYLTYADVDAVVEGAHVAVVDGGARHAVEQPLVLQGRKDDESAELGFGREVLTIVSQEMFV